VTWIVITYTLPVPGCPTGYTGPGGIHNNSANYDCIGGAASYVDKMVLGETHIYKWPTAREIYFPDGGFLKYFSRLFTIL